jgi:uroporphyrinogen-III decarboxylase
VERLALEAKVEGVQLPNMQSTEYGTDSTCRERVGKTVTLQGNLDPCALYASEVTTGAFMCAFLL